MEDERDGVGPGSSDGVSESSLSGKFHDKSPVENTGDMKQNFEEGKDGEIMVEVVGSDVFVDGIGGQKVGGSGFGEAGGLAENKDEKRQLTVVEVAHSSNEVVRSKTGSRQLELSGSTGEPSCHERVSELQSKGVGLLNEAQDPGEKVGDLESGEIGDLARDKDHKMEDISVQTDEVSNAGGKNQMEARNAALLGSMGEQSNIATEEVNISIRELQRRGVNVSLETLKRVAEVLDLGNRDTGNLAGNKDQAREETVFKATDVSNEDDVITKGSMGERIDTVVGGVDVGINKSADVGDGGSSELESRGVGVLLTESPGDERLVLSTSSVMEIVFGNTEEVVEGNSAVVHKDKVVTNEAVDKSSANFVLPIGEDKTCAAEKEKLLMSNDSTAVLDRSGEDSATTLEATEAADSAQISQPVILICPIHDNDKSEIDGAVGEAGLVNSTEGEDVLVSGKPSRAFDVNMEVVESVEEKEGLLVESKGMDQQTHAITSNSLDDDEHCLNRCHETKHQIDDTDEKPLDCETGEISSLHQNPENDGAGAAEVKDDKVQNFEIQAVLGKNQPEITNQSLNETPTDAAIMNGQIAEGKPLDCEIGTLHQNPENYDGGGGAAEVKEDKVKFFEIQAVMEENQITNQSLNTTPMDIAAINGQISATSQADVDEDVSSDKGKKTDREIIMQSPEFMEHTESQGVDVSTDTLQRSPKDSCLNVEMVDVVSMKNGDGSIEKGKKGDHQMVMQSLEFTGDPGNQSFDVCTDDNKQQNDPCLNVGTVDDKAVENHVMSNNLVVHTQIRLENAAEECGFTQTSEQVDASGITETSYHAVGKHEALKSVSTEVARNSDVSITDHASVHSVEHQLGTEEPASEANKSTFSDEETKISASSLRKKQLSYLLPQENVKQFTQSDLVWGKVRSHPWWPAQIFSPENASEKAVKHYKKDAYLVAYFGDGTFAWNHAPHLKPFMSHFSQFKNQTNSDAFRNAVNCALEEVSRRVELGLACSCIPKEAYKKIESQVIDNAGICKESSHRYGVDQCTGAATFEPVKLLKYLSNLAPSASSGTDQLNLVIARAQLSSFYHYKGYRWPTEFHEADVELSAEGKVYSRRSTSQKSKHTAKDSSLSREDISSAELMDDREFSLDAESESDSEDLGNSAPEKESDSEDLGKSIPLSSGRKRKAIYSPSSSKNHQGKSLSSGGKRKAIYSPSSIKNHREKSVSLSYGRKRKAHDYPSSTENHLGKSVPMSSGGRKWKANDSPSSTENYLGKSAVLSSGRKRKTFDSPSSTENYRGKSVSLSSDRKQKTIDSRDDRTERRWSHSASKLPAATSQAPKPSFKIGECIRRVASQLKGSATLVKGKHVETATYGSPNVNIHSENQNVVISEESFSVNEIFLQLKLLAQNPSSGHSLKNNVRSLIMDFRNSAALTRPGKKGKVEPKKSKAVPTTARSGEEFEFYEGNDSYWMDRTVLNYSEDELSDDGEDDISSGAEESLDSDHRSGSRIRLPCGHYAVEIMELDEDDEKRRRQESSPAELIMNFEERGCVPSEINLNKLFRRFGSLMESETEVDHESGRAKVIFKRGFDAEVARSSAEKFNIFGAATVEYEIGYSPVVSVKILPDPVHQI